jgi:hypothetical protein
MRFRRDVLQSSSLAVLLLGFTARLRRRPAWSWR